MGKQFAGILLAISTSVPLFFWLTGVGLRYRSICEEAMFSSPSQLVLYALSFGFASSAAIKLSRYAAFIIPLVVILTLAIHSWHQFTVAEDAIRMAAQCGFKT